MSHGHAPSPAIPRLARSSLVGREREVSMALAALDAGHRLVCLVGGPGVGKTRVMERLAHELRGRRDAVWVDLADAHDANAFVTAMAEALGVSLASAGAKRAPQVVSAALGQRPLTVLLDNLEQLADTGVERIIAGWLDSSETTVVATSRARLRLMGEHLVEVGPLSTASAIALLEERVVAARGTAHDPGLDLVQMQRVVTRLGNNPLAIEIAAARAPLLGAEGLLTRLEQSLDVLALDAHDRSPRQSSVRAALQWSWALLSDSEKRALMQLTVFRGGLSLEAAEGVVLVPGRSGLDLVEALRDRSLLEVERSERGLRFSLCPLVRDLAVGQADGATLAAAASRHAQHFARQATVDPSDSQNVEAAFAHASDPALVAQLGRVLSRGLARRGSRDVHEQLLTRALDAARTAGLQSVEAELLQVRAGLASAAGEVRLARLCQERALVLADRADDDRARSFCRARLGWDVLELGDPGELEVALAHLRAGVALAQRAGSVEREAYARNRLGHAALAAGNAGEALEELARAATLAGETRDRWLRQKTLVELIAVHRRLGLVEGAARRLMELDAICADSDDVIGAMALRERGGLLRALGRLPEADQALGDAAVRADALAAPRIGAEVRTLRARLALDRDDLGAAVTLAEEALVLASAVENPRYRAATLVVLGAARAQSGDASAAHAAFCMAETALMAGGRAVDAVTRVQLLVEQVLLFAAQDDAAQHDAALAELLAAARPLGGGPWAQALALSVCSGGEALEEHSAAADRALSRAADEEARCVLLAARGAHTPTFALARRIEQLRSGRCARELLVAGDGRFYEVDGRRTSLTRQRCLRLIFLALVEHAERTPGIGMTQAEVLSRGWPGEKMRSDSGATRVYTSIRRLRKSGLSGVLVTRDDGYLLDPTVAIRRVHADA